MHGAGRSARAVVGVGARPAGNLGGDMTAPDAIADRSPDLDFGSFSDRGPWILDPDQIPVALGDRAPACRGPVRRSRGCSRRAGSLRSAVSPAPSPRSPARLRLADLRVPAAAVARRDLPPPAQGVRPPRLELREARPDHLGRRGALPRRDGHRVQAAARPGAARDVRGRPGRRRGRPRRHARGAVQLVRRGADRGGLDRPGARRPAHHRRRGRRQGAAAAGGAALPRRHRRALVARARG